MDIKEKLNNLPNLPGVYLLKDRKDEIIYIGKASRLKNRVVSYFRPDKSPSLKRQALSAATTGLDYMTTDTEVDALLLEASLIKRHRPKYNVMLKDDKSYPYLKLTSNEDFPRLFITRNRKDDKADYFGPYTDVKLLRKAIALMRRIFPLRKCRLLPSKSCLDYQIGQCLAPCIGKVSVKDYRQLVNEVVLFLKGRRKKLIDDLVDKMNYASRIKSFEEAAKLRDRIDMLSKVAGKKRRPDIAGQTEELKEILGLFELPRRIFAYDISDIQGSFACGVRVSFYGAKADKAGYRRFRIKEADTRNDYQMMKEVVKRSLKGLAEKSEPLPDLIIIDGGKGHLGVVRQELDNLGFKDIPAISIAKKLDHIFTSLKQSPLVLPPTSKALQMVQRIRDEAHRFAIFYHHSLRKKSVSQSELDQIKGVGPLRKKELINYFGSLSKVKRARLAGLVKVNKIDRQTAGNIIEYFRKGRQ
ncbi:MAG: excinuclease ABC subunit UvrC [Candidatus Omnitrophota bacterium]|nr:excinuclease ABC subunit UvrC [Candidatus Omnitrophota bacterium]